MKKLLAICLIAFSLAGCVNGRSIFEPVNNPISNDDLAGAISTYGLIDTGIIAYRGLPRCTLTNLPSLINPCYKRSVLVQLQAYDKAANLAVNTAVEFKRNNPTLNASSYVDAAVSAVDTFKAFAIASGVPGVK